MFGVDMTDPEPIRFLDDEGHYSPSASAGEFAAELEHLDVEDLKQWYRDMAAVRAFDTECTDLQRQGQLALWAPSVGQAGGQVGIAHAALPQDHMFPCLLYTSRCVKETGSRACRSTSLRSARPGPRVR